MSKDLVPYAPRRPDRFDRSRDPVVIRQTIHEGATGQPDLLITAQYVPTNGPHGPDLWAEYDLWVAMRMMSILLHEYPGHPWKTEHDSIHGLAKIGHPILMGVNNWMAVNLKTHELTPKIVIRMGGEILERYRLRRGELELGSFLEARQKHSALLIKSRRVPG